MTTTLEVRHLTTYRYANPVTFGDHRMMLRPRDSHDMRVLDTALVTTPPASVRWVHDVFGNSIAIATFVDPAATLTIESVVRIEHYPATLREIVVDASAATFPFLYDADDLREMVSCLALDSVDPENTIAAWARTFVEEGISTLALLTAMTIGIQRDFTYARRDEPGTQSATETLATRTGSCRDFALLLMDAARSLGIAARFVSGYLYDESRIGGENALVGSGATHAWADVFLPGAGWVELDPTNGIVGSTNLIRVAVARAPSQAVPLAGSFVGGEGDYLGMSVDVTVTVTDPNAKIVAASELTPADDANTSEPTAPIAESAAPATP